MLMFRLNSATAIAPSKATAQPVAAEPIFSANKRSSSTQIEGGATLLSQAGGIFDIDIAPTSDPITAVTLTVDGAPAQSTAALSYPAGSWRSRINPVPLGIKQAVLTVATASREESTTFYLGAPDNVAVDVLTANVADGQTVNMGETITLTMARFSDRPGCTKHSTTLVIYRVSDGQHLSSSTYPDADASAGIASISHTVSEHDSFSLRQVNRFDCGGTITEDPNNKTWVVHNPAPTPAPADTTLTLFPIEIYEDGEASVFTWADHQHALTRRWLTVGSQEIELDKEGGLLTDSVTGLSPGSYVVQAHAEFSDTVPAIATSAALRLTVLAVPVAEKLDNAFDAPTDNTKLQAVLDDAAATPRQKAVAADLKLLNEEILDGSLGEFTEIAKSDRAIYAAEQLGKTNPATFEEWRSQQEDITNAEEQNQLREVIVNAPTSSIAALMIHFNSQVHPWGSAARLITGMNWDFVDDNAQSRGGLWPDYLLLDLFGKYKTYADSATLINPFDVWRRG